jgi:hypothetical protein
MASPAPISESQLAANRANAQLSTGPTTPAGKSRTRLNGLRHGLTGQTALLPDEDREAYAGHHAEFLAELRPEGLLETQLAHGIADDYWRLNRIKAIEDNIFALGIESHSGEFSDDALTDNALSQAQTYLETSKEINLLSLYEQRLNRAVHKKHAELAELQRVRKVAAARQPPRNGFGFSTGEIARPATPPIAPPDLLQVNIHPPLREFA